MINKDILIRFVCLILIIILITIYTICQVMLNKSNRKCKEFLNIHNKNVMFKLSNLETDS